MPAERTGPPAAVIAVAATFALIIGLVVGVGGSRLLMVAGPAPGPGGGAAAGGAEAGGQAPAPPPATVRVGQATQQTLQRRFEVIGRLQEIRRATVAAEVEGRVIEADVDAGAHVEGGKTVLARIDGVWAKLALQAAQARVAAAEATLKQSQSDLNYLEQLAAANSARPREVEDQRAQVKSDEAELNAAIAERDTARQRVERLSIVAPFDGAVVDKLVEVGQWVDPGAAVAELISTGAIEAVIHVPESLINDVAVGAPIEVLVEPLSRRATGKVVAIVPSGGNAARTFPVKIRLDDRDGALKAGMSVAAFLPVGEESERLTVPRDAVLFGGGKATVWAAVKLSPDAELPSAMPISVEVLFGEGDRYAVRALPGMGGAKLLPDMPVVIEGAEKLFPTQPLQIIDPDQEQAQADQRPSRLRNHR